jgi:hypothetical protein
VSGVRLSGVRLSGVRASGVRASGVQCPVSVSVSVSVSGVRCPVRASGIRASHVHGHVVRTGEFVERIGAAGSHMSRDRPVA